MGGLPQPSEMAAYLTHTFGDLPCLDISTMHPPREYQSVDLNADGTGDRVLFAFGYSRSLSYAQVQSDVNGDGREDLVVVAANNVFVLLQGADGYERPQRLGETLDSTACFGPSIWIDMADWTGDGAQEILVQTSGTAAGGPGATLYTGGTQLTVLLCERESCHVAWSDVVERIGTDTYNGGFRSYRNLVKPVPAGDNGGLPQLIAEASGFDIFCCGESNDPEYFQRLQVYTSTVTTYALRSGIYEEIETRVIAPAATIKSQSQLKATSSDGHVAEVEWFRYFQDSLVSDRCHVLVDGVALDRVFGCRHEFTQARWVDLTGDGVEELAVTAFSMPNVSGPLIWDDPTSWEELDDETCPHQRLLAYSWDGGQLVEVANVAGCVIQSDLYGVRLTDVDGDGVQEIMAAPLEQDDDPEAQHRIYKWSGRNYVFYQLIRSP